MIRPQNGRALFYTRDSGGKHEMTPTQYVNWAVNKSKELGPTFRGTPEAITDMIAHGTSHQGDLFLDYDVSGNQLSRDGLNRLIAEVAADPNVSHVMIPRRDRLARPDNPIDGMTLENSLSRSGVTLVFMDRIVPPLACGEREDIAQLITSLIDYDHAGKDRRELARKILLAQLALARNGYSIGGRPPYGFCRYLTRDDGTLVRPLEEGERIRRRGHHVVWQPLPDDHPHTILIRRILSLLETMPASRVAATLTAEGIPSPDAGRTRKDRGILHPVSGVWHQPTIVNIARNPLLLGICTAGRRSMGDQLRHSPEGPRVMSEHDYRANGKPKVVRNPDESIVKAPARFEPPVDVGRHRELLAKLDERAGTQRGKPRSRNPAMNPLGGRIYDMACTWPMYRTPYSGSFRYSCGAYLQSHGQVCDHNHVDGPTGTQFALSCLQQRVLRPSAMAKLEARLRELAAQQVDNRDAQAGLAAKESSLARLEADVAKAKRNLALADTEEQHRAVAEVFDELIKQKVAVEAEVRKLKATLRPGNDRASEVQIASDMLTQLRDLASNPTDLASVGDAFKMVNLQLFMAFQPVQIKKRTLNKFTLGMVTFGDEPLPIAPYRGPTGRRGLQAASAATVAAKSGGGVTLPTSSISGREGNSLRNVSRGDSRSPFVYETPGWRLIRKLFPQVVSFDGDAVRQFIEPGLYTKRRKNKESASS